LRKKNLEKKMTKKMKRREFLRQSAFLGISSSLSGSLFSGVKASSKLPTAGVTEISAVSGPDFMSCTIQAVNLLGGIEKFVPEEARVAIIPNAQSNHPGTFTSPEVLSAVIRMCKKAGAKEVNCLSWLPAKFWERCGLSKVIEEEGAKLVLSGMEDSFFTPVEVPQGKALKEAWVMKELFQNDVFIDVPIVKDHAGNKFTGTLKNLMGLNSPQCNRTFHLENWDTDSKALEHLDQSIADLNTVVKPALCIADATTFILTNGPFGPGKLKKPQTVVAGTDRVAVDAYCSTLLGLKPEDIIMIKCAAAHGLGEIDLNMIKVKTAAVG
jgi:uncharacterized protein (DUF362 family)